MGRQPSRLHGRAGGDGAAGKDAGLERRGDGASRKAIMEDPAWKDGNYDAPPEKGIRLWRDIVGLLAARTPDMYSAQFKNGIDVLPWMEQQETALLKAFDANDWIYQT
jgi:homoserine O-acetyltransferase